MNSIDAAVLAVVLIVGLLGYWRGLLRELAALLGLVAGLWLGYLYAASADPPFTAGFGLPSPFDQLAAFAIVFLAVYLAGALLGWGLSRRVRDTLLDRPNQVAGLLFGGAKGLFIATVLLVVLDTLAPFPAVTRKIEASMLGKPLIDFGRDAAVDLREQAARLRRASVRQERGGTEGGEARDEEADGEEAAGGAGAGAE